MKGQKSKHDHKPGEGGNKKHLILLGTLFYETIRIKQNILDDGGAGKVRIGFSVSFGVAITFFDFSIC